MAVCGNASLVETSTTPFPAPVAGDCCLRVRYTCQCIDGVSTWVLDAVNTACVANDLCAEYAYSCSDLEYEFEAQNYCDCAGILPALPDPSCDPHCCDSSTTTPVTSTSSTTTTSTTTTTTVPVCPEPEDGGIGDFSFDVTDGTATDVVTFRVPEGPPDCCYKIVVTLECVVGPSFPGIQMNIFAATVYTAGPPPVFDGEFRSGSCAGPVSDIFNGLVSGANNITETRYICGGDTIVFTIFSGCHAEFCAPARIHGALSWVITKETDPCT